MEDQASLSWWTANNMNTYTHTMVGSKQGIDYHDFIFAADSILHCIFNTPESQSSRFL